MRAIDFSEVALEKLEKKAKLGKLSITTELADLRTYRFAQTYDLILAAFVLHHLRRAEVAALIQNMMAHTAPNGLHMIAAFTQEGDFYRNERGKDSDIDKFYARTGELTELYGPWKILRYEGRTENALAKYPDDSPMKNICAYLLAQKIF